MRNLDKHLLTLIKGNREEHVVDGNVTAQLEKPQLKRPSLYNVVIFNDDYTPMEFVVHVLQAFFGFNQEKSTQIMLRIHTEGKAICGTYTKDVAETKATLVNEYSQENEHPLLCEVEILSEDNTH